MLGRQLLDRFAAFLASQCSTLRHTALCRAFPLGSTPVVWAAYQLDRACVALDQRPGMRALAVLYLVILHLLAIL